MARQYANLPEHEPARTFANFDPVKGTEAAWDAARAVAGRQGPTIVVLSGRTGCGKTHLLEAIGWFAMTHATKVRYEYLATLFKNMRDTIGEEGSFTSVLAPALEAKILLLDEIGLRDGKPTDFEIQELTELLTNRLASGRHVVLTTNLLPEDIRGILHPRLASRLLDTATGDAVWVTITAGDYRTAKGE